MFFEALVSRDELEGILTRALPLIVHLDESDDRHRLELFDLTQVDLVTDVGLRIVCKARLDWSVMGIDTPLTLHSMRVMLVPEIVKAAKGDTIRFRLELEHADIAGVPDILDNKISAAVNSKLASVDLTWNFSETLAIDVKLPKMMHPLEGLRTKAAWGKVRVTHEALVIAISVHVDVLREGVAHEVAPIARTKEEDDFHEAPPRLQNGLRQRSEPLASQIAKHALRLAVDAKPAQLLTGLAVLGMAAGSAYFGLKALAGRN